MLAHVLPAARHRGTQNMTIRAHGAKHSPSAHAVRSTEGRKFGFQRKFVILNSAGQYPHSITWSFRICGIGTIRNTLELSFSALGSEFGFQSTSKLLRKWYFLGPRKSKFSWKKWSFPNRSRITPGRSWDLQGIKKHQRDGKTSTWELPEKCSKIDRKPHHLKGFGT